MSDFNQWYVEKLSEIVIHGENRADKFSLVQQRYETDISVDGLPLLAIKPTPWRLAVKEMLWFISDSYNYSDLHNSGCTWWGPWLKQLTKQDLTQPIMSPLVVSAKQLPYKNHALAFNRISNALRAKDFNSTRLYANLWPAEADLSEAILPPCALAYQLFVAKGKLHMSVTQRSADIVCGVPSNVAQYAFLLSLYGEIAGLPAGKLVMNFGDLHAYTKHVLQPEWQELNSFNRKQSAKSVASKSKCSGFNLSHVNVNSPKVNVAANISLYGLYAHCGNLSFPVVPVHTDNK